MGIRLSRESTCGRGSLRAALEGAPQIFHAPRAGTFSHGEKHVTGGNTWADIFRQANATGDDFEGWEDGSVNEAEGSEWSGGAASRCVEWTVRMHLKVSSGMLGNWALSGVILLWDWKWEGSVDNGFFL